MKGGESVEEQSLMELREANEYLCQANENLSRANQNLCEANKYLKLAVALAGIWAVILIATMISRCQQ